MYIKKYNILIMGFFGKLLKFKKLSKKQRTSSYETVQTDDIQERINPDQKFEQYYVIRSHLHIDKVLSAFNRETPVDFEVALLYMHQLGLMHPYADSIKYLKNMKKAATWRIPH
jgi:hypothetical protein